MASMHVPLFLTESRNAPEHRRYRWNLTNAVQRFFYHNAANIYDYLGRFVVQATNKEMRFANVSEAVQFVESCIEDASVPPPASHGFLIDISGIKPDPTLPFIKLKEVTLPALAADISAHLTEELILTFFREDSIVLTGYYIGLQLTFLEAKIRFSMSKEDLGHRLYSVQQAAIFQGAQA